MAFPLPGKGKWTKVDNLVFDWLLSKIPTLAELKILLYVYRHTYGFGEQERRISLDEFRHGRKKIGGDRMDDGTGLSENAVRQGIAAAVDHDLLVVRVDGRDKARTAHWYSLNFTDYHNDPDTEDDFDPNTEDDFDSDDEDENIENGEIDSENGEIDCFYDPP